MNLAPIVLFVFNRLSHTQQTINALKKNTLSNLSDLIIYSDAPKTQEQTQSVQQVRDYIKQVNGFKTVTIVEREINFGLAKSIIEGVTEVCEKYGRIIVLEDDLETSPYFLQYMNDALDIYKDINDVMHVSGYMFPISGVQALPETFFMRTTTCWGWATWNRAWKSFKKDLSITSEFTNTMINKFNLEGSYDYWAHVRLNEKGILNTWAIFWYASVFQKNGLCLHPAISMVSNIGNDNTGSHCMETSQYDVVTASKPIIFFEADVKENSIAVAGLRQFYISLKLPLSTRVMRKIRIIIKECFK